MSAHVGGPYTLVQSSVVPTGDLTGKDIRMSPRAVDKRARPGNEGRYVPAAPLETPTVVAVLEAAAHLLLRPAKPGRKPAKVAKVTKVAKVKAGRHPAKMAEAS
jgi:hypothetical protein